MNAVNNVANFNGQRPVIDPGDAVLLLIDHQSGLFQTVKDMEMTVLRANVTTLAKVATLAKIPVITSASVPQGPNGPLIPEIHRYAPHAKYRCAPRSRQINAWDNPDFVAAVKATGRTSLIITGTITSVCMAFPCISAVHDGYKVFAVVDASGTYSKMAQESPSPASCKPASCQSTPPPCAHRSNRRGAVRTQRSGPKPTARCSRPISC